MKTSCFDGCFQSTCRGIILENKLDLRSVSITFRVHAQLSINGQVRLEFSTMLLNLIHSNEEICLNDEHLQTNFVLLKRKELEWEGIYHVYFENWYWQLSVMYR